MTATSSNPSEARIDELNFVVVSQLNSFYNDIADVDGICRFKGVVLSGVLLLNFKSSFG